MLQIEIDGVLVDPLPDLEGVLVLNIECWSAGCRPWQVDAVDAAHVHPHIGVGERASNAQHTGLEAEAEAASRQRRSEEPSEAAAAVWRPQRIDDGLVEVLGLRSVVHIGQLQTLSEVGFGDPLRLGQGRVVRLLLTPHGISSALRRPHFPLQV